jgi:hypothetical protein
MRDEERAFNLDEMARRVVRGRLRHGRGVEETDFLPRSEGFSLCCKLLRGFGSRRGDAVGCGFTA